MNNKEATKILVDIRDGHLEAVSKARADKKLRDSERAMAVFHYVRVIEAIDLALVALSKP